MKFEYLSRCPDVAPLLAQWHFAEWGHLIPGWSSEIALAELQSHVGEACIPTTLVALEDGRPLGSVSLLVDDLDDWVGVYSPWLASLYVRPEERGRGIGGKLVARAEDIARAASVRRLHVFAAASEAYYLKRGWHVVERLIHHGVPSSIMSIQF